MYIWYTHVYIHLIYMHTHAPYHSQLVVHVRPSDEGPAPAPDIVDGTAALTYNPMTRICICIRSCVYMIRLYYVIYMV